MSRRLSQWFSRIRKEPSRQATFAFLFDGSSGGPTPPAEVVSKAPAGPPPGEALRPAARGQAQQQQQLSPGVLGVAGGAAVPLRKRRLPPGSDPALTDRCRTLAGALGLPRLAESVIVCWNARLQTTAGLAFFSHSIIQLNPKLLGLGDRHIERTLRHELAHLVAHARHPRRRIKAHGEEWKQACRDLGIGDEARCHSLPLGGRTVRRRFAYECPSCRSILLRVRRFSRFTACYPCCRRHNKGRYDHRFRLAPIPMDEAERVLRRHPERGAAPRHDGPGG